MDNVPETTIVDTPRVWCDGAGDIRNGPNYRSAALGHPRVYMQIDEKGYVDCGYCDRRFVLKGGPAERGINELGVGDLPAEEGVSPA
ncbi:putative Zn-finger protein [Altererythrobacter atlanticus]|uniref:Zinc-finger domain protein n=1 Tax=Croceibacterium atlanticum TaxID=1267766 RepID=A0A0F7KU09_9SPHN|nr:zinc-finger domain-containing protein [Croceibacterium atlanticum]AKH43069.1 Zinc-finger domain protein [Croceibacterium atlanticum]MBB5732228.1 putative Zn-finger protein [Croceibacterium atlanticum]